MTSHQALPSTHRALVLSSISESPTVKTIPTPQPSPGSAVVRILVANVIPYMRDIYDGTRNYPFPTPLVTGTSAIGRVAAVGPDATSLQAGQLVHVDIVVRGRDDPSSVFLLGVHEGYTEGSRKLMHGEWRNGTYAEYAKIPLESCTPLDEKRLLGKPEDGGLGYKVEDLAFITKLLVPYGGLRDVDLKAGETVVVAPATGNFGGAAVLVALAMGSKVIALGRNLDALKRISATSERVDAVTITGDIQADAKSLGQFGPVNVFFDISPPEAAQSTHIKSGILSLKHSGRVSLMGGIREEISIPYSVVMSKNLQLKGKWMYEQQDIGALIKMVEVGVLKLGEGAGVKVVDQFGLDEWDKAFTAAAENTGMGMSVLLRP